MSVHHQNTKKLVDAINDTYHIKTTPISEAYSIDLHSYDTIGFASGIAFGKFYEPLERFMKERLPYGKKVFFLYSCGKNNDKYICSVSDIARTHVCEILGSYGCLGFDTYGFFKLIGGISKGHPTRTEIEGAVTFFEKIISK